jgi:hypothetical protein
VKKVEPKTTPAPWRRDGSQIGSSLAGCGVEHTAYIVGGKDGQHPTIFVSSYCRTKRDVAQFEENVALILRAVNASASTRKEAGK